MFGVKIKTLFKGNLRPEDVIIREVKSGRKIDKDLEKLAAGKWQEIVEKAHLENKKVWDSEIYRLEKVISNGATTLWVSTIKYSTRVAMREFTELIKKLGLKYAPMGMYSSCFVKTSDDKYLFIEKSDKYFTTRKYSFIGGVISKSEKIIKDDKDLFESVKREINEEIKVPSKNISSLILKAGYVTETFNFCLVFEAKLKVTVEELKEIFYKKKIDEAVNIIGIERDQLPDFIAMLPENDRPKFKVIGLFK